MSGPHESRNAALGERVELVLEAMPGAGFVWRLERDIPSNAPVQLLKAGWAPQSTDRIGAPSTQHFEFIAVARGSIELTFLYGREWESTPRERRQFTLTIT